MGTRDWHPVGTLQSAPFPFSRGLLEARPYSKERFVLVYDLDVLPRASEVHVTVVREEKGNEGKTS